MRLGIVVLVAGIVCSALARYLTSPLRALRLSAQQLAGGNLSVRVGKVAARRHDEIGALGRDFDLMAEQLESLVSAQRRLFQDMSHELHSPLARLHMALGLANQKGASGIADELKRIEREAGRLNDLVRELLTLARLEGGVPVPDEESIDLEELVQAIVADGDYEARNRNRRVQLNHCDACIITGSPNVLRRSVENVVRNGIRYTKEGSQVEVSLHTEQCEGTLQAVIRIRDYGPGVPVDALEAIFRPFHRVEMDRNQQTGGVGLGLAIAHQAVRIHGGTISAANAPDAGLIVKICLPLRITHRS